VAFKLYQDINEILTKYDGVTGGAQIIPAPRNIRITTTPDDWTNQTKNNAARQPGSTPGCRLLRNSCSTKRKDKKVNSSNKRTQPRRREHLFSPHTDQCIYCGKSAQDDAIENTPCGSDQPASCGACGGKGWLWCIAEGDHPPREEVQRCDACQEFANDQAALEAVVKAAESKTALLKFVEEVAPLKHEDEPSDDSKPFEITSEDAIATLNQLILEARQLLGTADKCSKCGQVVPYVIGCLDGTELCQDCFDAGQN
jgi:hypothetical protein